MIERGAALLALILPSAAIVCAGGWKVFTWAMDRHDEALQQSHAVVQGQVIPPPSDHWAEKAYAGLERELADERADHAHTMHRHRHCHDRMTEAGIAVPDDH